MLILYSLMSCIFSTDQSVVWRRMAMLTAQEATDCKCDY